MNTADRKVKAKADKAVLWGQSQIFQDYVRG